MNTCLVIDEWEFLLYVDSLFEAPRLLSFLHMHLFTHSSFVCSMYVEYQSHTEISVKHWSMSSLFSQHYCLWCVACPSSAVCNIHPLPIKTSLWYVFLLWLDCYLAGSELSGLRSKQNKTTFTQVLWHYDHFSASLDRHRGNSALSGAHQ